MNVIGPPEILPEIGTVLNPAASYDGEDVFLCYRASERAGISNVVLRFHAVIDFQVTPINVEGLNGCRYPLQPWAFNEVMGSSEVDRWKALHPRFWLISFNDVTVEILFESVSVVHREPKDRSPNATLIELLGRMMPERD